MKDPIRICHTDDDDEARARHARIEQRLDQAGPDQVRIMIGTGFPTQWNPIIMAWLAGDKLEKEEAKEEAKEPAEKSDG